MVVIHPNYTIAWYLESFDEEQHTVTYTAQNDISETVRYFVIRKEWSGDSHFEDGARFSEIDGEE
jgi:hypothetical protein